MNFFSTKPNSFYAYAYKTHSVSGIIVVVCYGMQSVPVLRTFGNHHGAQRELATLSSTCTTTTTLTKNNNNHTSHHTTTTTISGNSNNRQCNAAATAATSLPATLNVVRSNTPPLPPLPTSFVAIKCGRNNEPTTTTNSHTGLHKFNHTDRPAPLPHPLTLESPNNTMTTTSTLGYLAHHGHHSTILPNATSVSAAAALSPTICSTSLSTFQPVAPHHFNSLDYRERNQTHYKHGQGGQGGQGGHQPHYREPTNAQRTNTLDRRSAGAATSNATGCMGDYNQISPHYLQTFDSLDPYGVANLHLYRSQSKSQIYGRGSTASGSGSGSNDGSTQDAVLYHSNSTLNHYQQQQQQHSEQHYQSGNGPQCSQNQPQHHHHSLKHSKSGGSSKTHKSKTSAHQQQQHLTQQQQLKPTKSRSSRSLQQQQQPQSSATEKSGKMNRSGGKERKHNNNCNASSNTTQINNISKANSMTSQYSSSSESMQCDNNYY